jgi:tetratricopeptide (TPR) repeat protein
MLAVIGLHILGTRQSNEIWSSSESLWKEATIKSPNNGRAWMNYGNCLMERADFVGAENSYIVAERLWPVYPYIKVNLGILHAATNRRVSAEAYFKEALELDPKNPQMYHFYGKFLSDNQRLKESSNILQKGLDLSPNHSEILALKSEVDLKLKDPKAFEQLKKTEAETMVENNPTAENYLNLSLSLYNAGEYQKCIDACLKSLELKPDYALAYNNICTAYNQLKNWDKAIEYGEKGLKYDPTNELIKGNLKIAYTNKGK